MVYGEAFSPKFSAPEPLAVLDKHHFPRSRKMR